MCHSFTLVDFVFRSCYIPRVIYQPLFLRLYLCYGSVWQMSFVCVTIFVQSCLCDTTSPLFFLCVCNQLIFYSHTLRSHISLYTLCGLRLWQVTWLCSCFFWFLFWCPHGIRFSLCDKCQSVWEIYHKICVCVTSIFFQGLSLASVWPISFGPPRGVLIGISVTCILRESVLPIYFPFSRVLVLDFAYSPSRSSLCLCDKLSNFHFRFLARTASVWVSVTVVSLCGACATSLYVWGAFSVYLCVGMISKCYVLWFPFVGHRLSPWQDWFFAIFPQWVEGRTGFGIC